MTTEISDGYASIVWKDNAYVPYGALSAYGDRGKQIGILDGNKDDKVYECKGYSSESVSTTPGLLVFSAVSPVYWARPFMNCLLRSRLPNGATKKAWTLRWVSGFSYHCVEPQTYGSANVTCFLKEGSRDALGSTMYVDVDPVALGEKIVADLKAKREALGWN